MFSKELMQGVIREIGHTPRYFKEALQYAAPRLPHEKYFYGKHKHQYFCFFQPKKASNKPVVLFFHGGSWVGGKPELFTNRAKVFLDCGYPVIMPTHRKIPFFSYPDIREDLVLIFEKMQEVLKKRKMENRPIIAGGMSSGGNLAALSTFDNSIMEMAGFSRKRLLGALFCAAPLHLDGMPDSIVLRIYAGRNTSEVFQLASPIEHLKPSHHKPIMIIHGEEDGLVNYSSIQTFVERLKTITNCPLTFLPIKNGAHIDAVKWVGHNKKIRKHILKWMAGIDPAVGRLSKTIKRTLC